MRSLALLALVLFAPALVASEPWKAVRDPKAVEKVATAEKLAWLPRREALTEVRLIATLTKPGKVEAFDEPLGAFEIRLSEPDSLRIEPHGAAVREAEEILAHHDGKRCVLRDLMEFALWPYALYPDADRKSIGFAPKSRSKVRILDHTRSGLEVVFGRDGLPKQHVAYEDGKRGRIERFEFEERDGTWLLVARTAQGGTDATRWHWEKKDGLWLPVKIDRTFGKLEFRIDVEYVKIVQRPDGEPPKLPPRSDPAGLAALRKAETLCYDPVAEGVRAVRFRVTTSDERMVKDGVYEVSFTAPATGDVVQIEAPGSPGAGEVRRELIRTCFLDLVFRRPPLFPDLDVQLVTKHPEEEGTWVVSDRRFVRIDVKLFPSGAIESWRRHRTDPVATVRWDTFVPADGKALIEVVREPPRSSRLTFTWEKVEGIRLPKRVLERRAGSTLAMTAGDWEITKRAK